MEVRKVYVKTRAEFGKQCVFDIMGPTIDVEILPNPADMIDYILRSHCNIGTQHSKQLALHEVQTICKTVKNSGMFHFEGGWPKEINPRDEETTARFRRRVEKDDNWAPKLRKLFEIMEGNILQNGALNIYQHYFSDMIPTELVQPLGLRTVNIYEYPDTPKRPVTNISWSPDNGSRLAVSYCYLKFGSQQDYGNNVYIWQVDNPNEPCMALDPFCPSVVCEFNPRDPSVLASGLKSGQVCNWDIRTGKKPVQTSHLLYSHRDYVNSVRWLTSKSNTEFFSASSGGQAMWWDTRQLRKPIEILMFDFENPNDPNIDRAVGVSCLNHGPLVGTKFMFGMENGIVVTGTRKVKTNAEKLAVRLEAHFGPVRSADRNVFNPSVFLTVGDWTARIWAEDTREGCLLSTWYLLDTPTGGCWNKARCSVFYVMTSTGQLLAWDLLQGLRQPVFTLQLCKESLTAIAPYEEGTFLAVGNMLGNVYLVESTEFLQSFDKKDRTAFSEFLDRHSKMTKAVDVRLREIRLVQRIEAQMERTEVKGKTKPRKAGSKGKAREKQKEKGTRESRGSKRKSASKERKKREDSPQMIEAEQKYFEMVQKGMEEYAAESDPDLRPVPVQVQARKQERKPRRGEASASADDMDSSASKRDTRTKSRRIHVRKRTTLGTSGRISEALTAEGSDDESSAKLLQDELKRKRRKGRKPKITFTYPVPCKGEICKPRICCYRKERETRKERTGRETRESTDIEERTESTSVKWTSVKPTVGRKQAAILREMKKPPSELTREARRARAEISEMIVKTRTVRRTWQIQAKQTRKEQKPDGRKRRVREKRTRFAEDTEWDTKFEEDIEEESVRDEVGKRTIPEDPCSPPKGKSIMEEASAILGVPLKKIVEQIDDSGGEKKKSDEPGVYPRLSEYQGSID
ncbi:dynein axonemal intermediate chain 2-like [Megachile rotundata]|uniref:dynein axonemal intermediate chain 2-like n=1 Tax=Megachile rotundata TaxID=143995 RepID=UPI003FD51A44